MTESKQANCESCGRPPHEKHEWDCPELDHSAQDAAWEYDTKLQTVGAAAFDATEEDSPNAEVAEAVRKLRIAEAEAQAAREKMWEELRKLYPNETRGL